MPTGTRLTDEQRSLAERYVPLAERIARRMSLRESDRDEVRADALFGLVKAALHRRPDAPFRPYAQRCIEGAILHGRRARAGGDRAQWQRRTPRPTLVSLDGPMAEVAHAVPDEQAISPYRAAEYAELWRLVDGLPAREGLAIRLYYEQDLTQTEIGQALGFTQMQASRVLSQARDRLRDAVAA